MSSRVLAIIVGIIILAGAGAAAWVIFNGRNSSPTVNTPPTQTDNPPTTTTTPPASNSILSADPVATGEASKQRFASAQTKLGEWSLWKSNGQLSGLFMTFTSALELNSANEVYVFDSPDDPNHHYTVSVAQSSGNMLRALIPVQDYQGVLLPIKTEFWQSNYVEAVQFAHQNGGKEFVASNTITTVDVNLRRDVPNNFLYWIVRYNTSDSNISLTIKMDAKDKTLVNN